MAQEPLSDLIKTDSVTSVDLPSLSLDSYYINNIADRNYNYELLNKKRYYEMWSGEVKTIGMITLLALATVNAILAEKYEWNLWIDIPCATIAGCAILIPCVLWSNNLQAKADNIIISPTIGHISNSIPPNTAMNSDPSSFILGINIKKSI